jgi:DNA (cytosine-5)-methyltransferase 1
VLFPYRSNLAALDDYAFAAARSPQQKLYDDWVATWIFKYGDNRAPTLVRSGLKTGESRKDKWRQIGFELRLEAAPLRPEQIRSVDDLPCLTLGVLKRVQGLPDNWNLPPHISTRKASLLIANAFPPVMARAVGLAVRQALTGKIHDQNKAMQQPVIEKHRIGRLGRPFSLQAVMNPRWKERAPSAKARIWREHIVESRKEARNEYLLSLQADVIEDGGAWRAVADQT